MLYFEHDSIQFYYHDSAVGKHVFLVQHGLGGEADSMAEYVAPSDQVRVVGMDARAHGKTTPVGNVENLRFNTMANDMIALLDKLGIEQAIVGGVSMGAGLALNLGLRYPERVQALILSRPAWLNAAMPMESVFHEIAVLIRQHPTAEAEAIFRKSATYQQMMVNAPAVADSMCGHFTSEQALTEVARLEEISSDKPFTEIAELEQITVPTLVMVTRRDPVHPYQYGEFLAEHIPNAQFVELISKSDDAEEHHIQEQKTVARFMDEVLVGLAKP